MTDLDRELAEYGERWRAAQPPLPDGLLRAAGDRDGSGRSRTRATRRKRRARQRTIGVVAFLLVVASVPVWLAVTRDSSSGVDRAITEDEALVDVRAAIGRTVASGSYESDIETHSTNPATTPSCPPSVTCAPSSGASTFKSSGHIIVNFDPYVMRSDSNNSFGTTRLYVTPTNIWLQSGTGGTPSGPAGSGTPLSVFAKSIVNALGPSQGGLAAMNLAVPGGQMNLHEEAVASATPGGRGEVRGTPVTYYDVTIDLTRLADTPGLTDVQRDTIAYALPLLRQGGYSGTTGRIGVSDDGYIREITLTNHFTDGSTGTQHHVLSNFGCAPKVNPPDRQPPETEPRECKVAETPATAPPTSSVPATTTTAPSGSPLSAGLQRPTGVAVAPNGDVYVADMDRHQVLRRSRDGRVTVVAGTGTAGFAGDGRLAVDAMLEAPRALAIGRDGTLYLTDVASNLLRAVGTDGVIRTIASVPSPQSLAIAPDGSVYVAGGAGIERFAPDGSRSTVLVAGPGKVVIDGEPNAFDPSAVAVDGDGTLVVANSSPKWIARIAPDGAVLDAWEDYIAPGGLAVGPDGTVYLASYGFWSIERLTETGPVPVVKFERDSVPGISGTFRPQGVAVGPDGTVYAITNGGGGTNDKALLSIAANGTVTVLLVN